MKGEFGSTSYTNESPYSNSGKSSDNRAQRSNPSPHEFHDYSNQNESGAETKKGNHSLLHMLTTGAAVTVAAAAVLPSVMAPSIDVNFEALLATDTVIEYIISLDPLPEDNELSIVVATPNGSVVKRDPVEQDVVMGTVEGLLPGIRYEVIVMNGSAELASRSVVMAYTRVTELTDIVHECRCAIDGTFHFQIFFRDENGYWSEFKATLTDAYGATSVCDFSDSPAAEHTLDVNGVGMRGNVAEFVVTCTTTEPDENGNRTPREYVLYEAQVSI